ncbi:hypothetical protein IMSAG025_00452 [Muribaculaceae bacterium]|nr:hypothetical protein IMSAG025_00452 [Muribaculaceae bacterium]
MDILILPIGTFPVQLNVQPKDAKVYSIDAGMLERGMEKEENPETYLRLLSWIKGNSLNTIEHVEVNDRVDLSIFRSFYSTYPNARDG